MTDINKKNADDGHPAVESPNALPDSSYSATAERLRWAMKARGVSGAALAEKARFSPNTITRILTGGSTKQSTLRLLAEHLGVRDRWLINGENPMELPTGTALVSVSLQENKKVLRKEIIEQMLAIAVRLAFAELGDKAASYSVRQIGEHAAMIASLVERDEDPLGLLNRLLATRTPGKTP